MAKKNKNLTKQNIKKAQKQKKRREKLKKQSPQQGRSGSDLVDRVDMALELVEDGDLRSAKKALETLEKKHGDSAALQFSLGVVAIAEERYPEAAAHFEKTVAIRPDFVDAYINLALAYKMQDRMPEMVQALRQVIKRGKRGSDEVDQAKKMLNGLEDILKDDGISLDDYLETSYYFELGMDRMESGDWEDALISFRKGLDLNPNDHQSYVNMGICYGFLGKKQQAMKALDRSLALVPDYEPAHLSRSIIKGMKEGETLTRKLKSVNYYKDYPQGEGGLFLDYLEEQGILPDESEPTKQSTTGKKRGSKEKAASLAEGKRGLRISQYKITDEPILEPFYKRLPEKVRDRFDELMIIAKKNPTLAIPELLELKKKYPDVPKTDNFLAVAYSILGDNKKAEAIIEECFAKHPDYLFARLNYAQICIFKKEYEKIPEIFDNKFDLKMLCPERDTFHISEFVLFSSIMGTYFFWSGQIDIARRYNKSLQEVAPDTPDAKKLDRLLNSKEVEIIQRIKKLFGR